MKKLLYLCSRFLEGVLRTPDIERFLQLDYSDVGWRIHSAPIEHPFSIHWNKVESRWKGGRNKVSKDYKVLRVLKGNKDVIKNYNKVRTRVRTYLIEKRGLTSEIIEPDIGIVHSEGVQEIQYRLGHHRRSTEVVLDILGGIMLLEVGVARISRARSRHPRARQRASLRPPRKHNRGSNGVSPHGAKSLVSLKKIWGFLFRATIRRTKRLKD